MSFMLGNPEIFSCIVCILLYIVETPFSKRVLVAASKLLASISGLNSSSSKEEI